MAVTHFVASVAASFAPSGDVMRHRLALFAVPVAMAGVLLLPGAAVAGAGGEPASNVPPGCSFSKGVTTCSTTSETPGEPVTVETPGSFVSTAGPVYDFQMAQNVGSCSDYPVLRSGSTTTSTPTLETVTTAHRGAPGSNGKELETTTSTTSGTPVVTTTAPASPGTATVAGYTATATFAGLKPHTLYVTGERCGDAGVGSVTFRTDALGAGAATLNLAGAAGREIQLELAPVVTYPWGGSGGDYHGSGFAVTAPFVVN